MLLEWAKKNDYQLTINNNLKIKTMETKDLNKGVLFKNNNKKTDNHPDYTGKIVLANNKEYYLNAWINKSKAGTSYLNITIGNETTKEQPVQPKVEPKKVENDDFLF